MNMAVNIAGVEWKNPVTTGPSRNLWIREKKFSEFVQI